MSDERSMISRREFTAMSMAAGIAARAQASGAFAPKWPTRTSWSRLPTASATLRSSIRRPAHIRASFSSRTCSGLRPTMRDMAKRLAAHGFTVLVPNPFYRTTKAPGLSTDIDFANPADRAKIDAPAGAVDRRSRDARRLGLCEIPGCPGGGRQESQSGRFRLLHGRAYDPAGRCRQFGPNRRGGVVPRRGLGHRHPRQPASVGGENEGTVLLRRGHER